MCRVWDTPLRDTKCPVQAPDPVGLGLGGYVICCLAFLATSSLVTGLTGAGDRELLLRH